MGDVLVYADPADVSAAARVLAWARSLADDLGGRLVAAVAGANADEPKGLEAADLVLRVAHPALTHYVPEAHGEAVLAAIEACTPELVVFENTTVGIDLAAATAARTGFAFVGYCVELRVEEQSVSALSELYGGRLLATVHSSLPAVVTVNSTALPEQAAAPGRGEKHTLPPPAALEGLRSAFVHATGLDADSDCDITKAERLVCVGRGIGSASNVSVAEKLAQTLGAELAASRPVVDAGWLPKWRQVGKSGQRVKPKLYLALGVSGAPEHLEGMRDAELIIAVNTDPDAAIFNVAHFGAVADLFDVAEELQDLLA